MSRIRTILITHLHGDHAFGLFGLLLTLGLHGKVDPMTLVGPIGIRQLVLNVLCITCGHMPTDFEMRFIELPYELEPMPSTFATESDEQESKQHPNVEAMKALQHDKDVYSGGLSSQVEMDPQKCGYIRDGKGGFEIRDSGHKLSISAYPLRHRIPTFGYVIKEPSKRGRLNAKLARELGAEGPQLGQLAKGKMSFLKM